MPFTAHNIRLQNGSKTLPEAEWLAADSPWIKAALRTLRLFYGDRLAGTSIVDLGCLEGGFTVEFARLGMQATGIEVRSSNYENCLKVKQGVGLNNLEFLQDDVWNLNNYESFDAAFCCGLLYHLDRPAEFMRLLSSQVKDLVILHTHFSTNSEAPLFNLSPMSEHEGLPGRWYSEHNLDDLADLDQLKWHSWTNKRSFWPTRPALIQLLNDCGFDMVYEQYDMLGAGIRDAMEQGYYHEHSRSMFVGLRTSRMPSATYAEPA